MASGEKIADMYADLSVDTNKFDGTMTNVRGNLNQTANHLDNNINKARAFAGALNTVGTQGVRIDNVGMAMSNLGQAMNIAKLGAVGLGLEIGTSLGNAIYKIPAVTKAVDGLTQGLYDLFNPPSTVDEEMIKAGAIAKAQNKERFEEAEKAKKQAEDDAKYRLAVFDLEDARTKSAIQLGDQSQKINLLEQEKARIMAKVSKDRFEEVAKQKELLGIDTQLIALNRQRGDDEKKRAEDIISLQEDLAEKRFQLEIMDEQAEINKSKKSVSFSGGGTALWKQMFTDSINAGTDAKQKALDDKKAVKQRDDMVKGIDKVVEAIKETKGEQAIVSA